MRNKTIVPDCDQIANKGVRLDAASLPNDCAPLYLHKGADGSAVANDAPVQVDRLNNGNVFPKRYFHNPCVTDGWLRHKPAKLQAQLRGNFGLVPEFPPPCERDPRPLKAVVGFECNPQSVQLQREVVR